MKRVFIFLFLISNIGCSSYLDFKQLEVYRALRDGTMTCYIHRHAHADYCECIDRLFKVVGVK